eukprot:TRINITY_DN12534_c0_g1_i2.p1 TRINITY_DN12534_c0_g1~~TRINITY_DN12534_c0_g1_i2.p1  ORF type:complete len:376 (-),score=85.17 TRINITY_DN12534_c0_g1_i2:32-1159(-)
MATRQTTPAGKQKASSKGPGSKPEEKGKKDSKHDDKKKGEHEPLVEAVVETPPLPPVWNPLLQLTQHVWAVADSQQQEENLIQCLDFKRGLPLSFDSIFQDNLYLSLRFAHDQGWSVPQTTIFLTVLHRFLLLLTDPSHDAASLQHHLNVTIQDLCVSPLALPSHLLPIPYPTAFVRPHSLTNGSPLASPESSPPISTTATPRNTDEIPLESKELHESGEMSLPSALPSDPAASAHLDHFASIGGRSLGALSGAPYLTSVPNVWNTTPRITVPPLFSPHQIHAMRQYFHDTVLEQYELYSACYQPHASELESFHLLTIVCLFHLIETLAPSPPGLAPPPPPSLEPPPSGPNPEEPAHASNAAANKKPAPAPGKSH